MPKPKPRTYTIDRSTLTIGEECQIEQLTGLPIAAAWEMASTVGVAQAYRAFLLIAAQRADPDLTVDDVDAWKRSEVAVDFVDIGDSDEDTPQGEDDAP